MSGLVCMFLFWQHSEHFPTTMIQEHRDEVSGNASAQPFQFNGLYGCFLNQLKDNILNTIHQKFLSNFQLCNSSFIIYNLINLKPLLTHIRLYLATLFKTITPHSILYFSYTFLVSTYMIYTCFISSLKKSYSVIQKPLFIESKCHINQEMPNDFQKCLHLHYKPAFINSNFLLYAN